jgi:DNA replication licensing factor MCM3
MSIVRPRI